MINNAPVILLKVIVELIAGTSPWMLSKFCFNLRPAFIINGITPREIRQYIGKIS